jgi:hypothetical protein
MAKKQVSSIQLLSPSKDTINAPLTTLPVPLDLPIKSENMSQFKYLFSTGKAYVCIVRLYLFPFVSHTNSHICEIQLSFFKTGLANIYKNFIATRPLQEALDTHRGSFPSLLAASPKILTRASYQHIHRARHDVLRVPLFGLLFLICGEFSPLILPFVPSIVPYNCRIPRQLSRQRTRTHQQRTATFAKLPPPESLLAAARRELPTLNSAEVKHVARVLEVDSWVLPLETLRRFRVAKRERYLEMDDILLRRGGGVKALDGGEELMMAVQERGIDTVNKTETQLRNELEVWVRMTELLGGVKAGMWLMKPESWVRVVDNRKREFHKIDA